MPNEFISNEITIGNLPVGGHLPIRIQSMANTPTMDTEATVKQIVRLAEAGCEMVRITAANVREAENLKSIQSQIRERGIDIPLIADVHFQPKAAEIAAEIVAKVRINPGNYSGSFHKAKKYSDAAYHNELVETANNLKPLLAICKQHNTAIRIGINHGSLSDRILYRYGNTAAGMVASAMEFISICQANHFENLTLSLKASNVKTMVQANRLMVSGMLKKGLYFPLHLGVTEAGNGMEGRIKSAMGIGTLLSEGIGDTIRVSLTEKPENEIPVATKLASFYGKGQKQKENIVLSEYGDIPKHKRDEVVFINPSKRVSETSKIVRLSYPDISHEELILRAAVTFNMAYENASPDGLLIENAENSSNRTYKETALAILQARGLRFTKTEFTACPSCGRTHFNIEKTLEKIQRRLGNIKGLKIAVMGCVVNGPGEMAGADYGFVGAGQGKVNLYKKDKILYKNLSDNEALDKLEELISG